jgi:hypothetical protein
MQLNKNILITSIALCLTACSATPDKGNQSAKTTDEHKEYVWLTVGANNQQIAHAVTTASTCPHIMTDNHSRPMTQRAKGNQPKGFDQVISCETYLPDSAETVSVNGTKLKLFKKPQKIIVIGDTGCRMKAGDFQNCNNVPGYGPAWPWAKMAKVVAAADPDLIIHVGDYHYRESPCPPGNKGCVGPWGFNWKSWQADFFDPALPLLARAPWVFTRGNHEDCNRAWKGWFYLLDQGKLSSNPWQECQQFTPAYKVDLGDLALIQMDSATLPNDFSNTINPKITEQYARLYNEVNQLAEPEQYSWVMTHRPIWAVSSYWDWKNKKDAISLADAKMQLGLKASALGRFSDSTTLLLNGHIHNFEALTFDDGRPSLLVVGDSGTKLSPKITKDQTEQSGILKKLGLLYADFYSTSQFAYAEFERQPQNAWLIHLVDINGKTQQSFILKNKRLERVWE